MRDGRGRSDCLLAAGECMLNTMRLDLDGRVGRLAVAGVDSVRRQVSYRVHEFRPRLTQLLTGSQ